MSYRNDTNTQTSKVIHINSEDASVIYSSGISTDFSYELENHMFCPQNQTILVSCIGATIPYTFYNIRLNINDTISLRETSGGTIYTAIIPPGNYNSTTFADIVKTKVDIALSGVSVSVVIAYDREQMKYRLTLTGRSDLYFDTRLEVNNKSPYIELGLTKDTNNHINTTEFLPNVADVNGNIHGLYIRTNLVNNGVYDSQSKSLSHILTKIPIRVNFGGVIFYDSFEGVNHKIELDKREISEIRIRLTDERNRLIDLNGLNFTLAIMFDFVYKKNIKQDLTQESRRIQEIATQQQKIEETKPITIPKRRGRPRKVGRPKVKETKILVE